MIQAINKASENLRGGGVKKRRGTDPRESNDNYNNDITLLENMVVSTTD